MALDRPVHPAETADDTTAPAAAAPATPGISALGGLAQKFTPPPRLLSPASRRSVMTAFRRLASLPQLLIALAVLPWLPRSLRPQAGPPAPHSSSPAAFPRPARLALLALAVALAGVLLWSGPAPTQAQVLEESETVTLYSASFTASDVGAGVVGCDSSADAAATAVPCPADTLTYGGVTNAFLTMQLWPSGSFRLNVSVAGDDWPAGITNHRVNLDVNGTTFSFEDATLNFGDSLRWANSGLTLTVGETVTITITEEPEPYARATGFALDSNNAAPTGMWGNEDTIWVANNGAFATDKIYAYNRSDGSRDSGTDFDTLNGAGNNTPGGICSDGTTMFVADWTDDKLYAYKMSDMTHDSGKDISLHSDNGEPRGVWCDADTIWVANDDDGTTSKIFAYKRSDGSRDSAKDVTAAVMNPSTTVGSLNNSDPRGLWGNADTMFAVDDEDQKVYAYKTSDRSLDADKNITLDTANADPEGLWFDGRVLWVVDDVDDRLYAYNLPGANTANTPAEGAPAVRSTFSKDVYTATVTAAVSPPPPPGQSGYAVAGAVGGTFTVAFGSISGSTFTVDGVEYTVRAVLDTDGTANSGDLFLELDKALPVGFTFTVDGTDYASDDATENEPAAGEYRYQWSANLSWSLGTVIPVVLSVETPKDGVDVTADPSGITDATDGVASASFHYEWIRVDGTDETETEIGAVGATYTPTADDVGNYLKVRAVFNDDAGYEEYPITSPRFGPVVDAVPPMLVSAVADTANTIILTFDEPLDPDSIPTLAGGFSVEQTASHNMETADVPLDGVVAHPDDAEKIVLTVHTMLSRDAFTVTYTKTGKLLQDLNENEVEPFTDQAVENAFSDTFVSNLGQTVAPAQGVLADDDYAQRFDTGSTASFDFTEVEVLFSTVPSSSATVTAVIADGLGASDNIVATLTNPDTWSANAVFGIPDGTELSPDTTYYLIIEGDEGQLQATTEDGEDSGAAANWTIGDNASIRAVQTDSGLGGSWANVVSASFQIAVRGKHHGRPGTPTLSLAAKDQTLVLEVTVPDHGSSDLTDIEYSYKPDGGTFTSFAAVTGGTVTNEGGTFEIGGFTNGTEYTVQVQTVNDIGTSDASNEEKATPDAPPAIDTVAITSDPGTAKTYKIGDDIVVTVTFDKNIEFSGTGSDPYLSLRVGTGETKESDCTIGTAPTKDLVCTYPVAGGDEDSDGVSVPSGTISPSNTKLIVGPLGQNAVLTHSGLAADSDHKVDGVRPELTGARASADNMKIILTFSEALSAADRTKFTFDSGGTTLTTTGTAVIDTDTKLTVTITLDTALTAMDTNVTVALAADAVTDIPGNGNAVLAATAIVDDTAPELSTATTPSETEVLLTYNEPLDSTSIPAASAFTLVVNTGGITRTVSTAALDGTSGIKLTVSPAFRPGDVLTLSYTVPATNPIKDASANEAAALANQLVDNTLPATAPDVPGSLAADYNLIGFIPPLEFNADLMDLSWTAPWNNGSAIEKFQHRYHTLIWDGTLTVKQHPDLDFLGCGTTGTNLGCTPSDLLTDNTFSYDSVDYNVTQLDQIGTQLTLLTDQNPIPGGGARRPDAPRGRRLARVSRTRPTRRACSPGPTPASAGARTIRSSWRSAIPPPHGRTSPTAPRAGPTTPATPWTGSTWTPTYLFDVRAVNGIGSGAAASVERRTKGVVWEFTLRDGSSNDVTTLNRGRRFGDGDGVDHQTTRVQHRPGDHP